MLAHKIIFSFVVASLALLLSTASFSEPPTQKPVLMIIDASGSSADNIQSKRALTQEIFNDVAAQRTQTMHVGIMRYPFANEAGCGVTNLFIAGPHVDPAITQSFVSNLPPTTHNPLPTAIHNAVTALTTAPLNAVILILNTNANCSIDPCRMMKEIQPKNKPFTTYIVTFQSNAKQQQGFECLALTMPAEYINAQTPKALTSVLNKVLNPIQQGLDGYGSVNLKAISKENGSSLREGLRWWAFISPATPGGRSVIAQYSNQSTPHFELAPGTYTIQLTYGEAAVKQAITIESNQAQDLTLPITTATDYQIPQHVNPNIQAK